MDEKKTSFNPARLQALMEAVNRDPALLEKDWRDTVRKHFPLTPEEERSLKELTGEKVKHIQDFLHKAAQHARKGGAVTGKLVERSPKDRAGGLVYDIDVELAPAHGGKPGHR
ncbi:MAG: hypothetical protein ACJ8AD_20165 [Gemmatimonadaceae bacterium]